MRIKSIAGLVNIMLYIIKYLPAISVTPCITTPEIVTQNLR